MDRLSTYQSSDGTSGLSEITDGDKDVFSIFNEHVKGVIAAKTNMSTGDILSLHVSLIRFAMQCARSPEDQVEYANSVMGFCADFLEKSVGEVVDDESAELLVQLIEAIIQVRHDWIVAMKYSQCYDTKMQRHCAYSFLSMSLSMYSVRIEYRLL